MWQKGHFQVWMSLNGMFPEGPGLNPGFIKILLTSVMLLRGWSGALFQLWLYLLYSFVYQMSNKST